MRKNGIWELCGIIGHKSYACIISGPKFLPPSLKIKMNQFNGLYGEEPNEPPREWNRKPPASHFKYRTYTPKTSPLISDITEIINHHIIDNVDV